MSVEPKNLTGAPFSKGISLEDLLRATSDQIDPADTFDHLQRRARFNKQDKGLLRDWKAWAPH